MKKIILSLVLISSSLQSGLNVTNMVGVLKPYAKHAELFAHRTLRYGLPSCMFFLTFSDERFRNPQATLLPLTLYCGAIVGLINIPSDTNKSEDTLAKDIITKRKQTLTTLGLTGLLYSFVKYSTKIDNTSVLVGSGLAAIAITHCLDFSTPVATHKNETKNV